MSEYIAKCSEGIGINGHRFIVPDYLDTSKEIVRCKDCEHRYDNQCGRYLDWFDIELDGFCAWGERKERIES